MIVTAAPTQELIPGYVATERLGAGGYGEVWKVEAPGGLHKAIKIIYGFHDEERASRELKSLDHVRKVRHPFLLSLERIEVVDGRLMIVTELADMSLMDRYDQCRKANLPGIPRDELINHMRDAADALDFMFQTHSLQHLDVKPENLLLVSGRAKVADFGLVKEIADKTRSLVGAMTPTYAAPEVFDGRATRQSDQYSLAIVYQEMLTGVLPYPGRTAAQLAAQHTRSRPQLTALPASDREIIARSLSKRAEDRYPCCRDMVDALVIANRPVVAPVRQPTPAPGDRADKGTRVYSADDTRSGDSSPAAPGVFKRKSAPPEQCTEIIAERPAKQPSAVKRPSVARPIEAEEVQVTTHTVDLPPIEVERLKSGLRPTMFIGVGGTGAVTIEKLRERLASCFDEKVLQEAFPQLLVETDPTAVKRAMARGIDHQDAVVLALKQAHEYRGEAENLLHWLGRKWLYNIPKSGLTTGVRPWGRLALIDRAGQVVVKLRQRLTKLVSGACGQALASADFGAVQTDSPRVVLFGSCCGGTGGGMLLELAYAVRNIANQLGNKSLEICAVVTTSTNQCPTGKQLATANAVAFMTELQHYTRCGAAGDNGADARTAMFEGAAAPLDEVYFVDLGDDLTSEAFDLQLERVADYLYCDTATPLAAHLQAGRQPQPEEALHRDLKVRSLKMAMFEGLDERLLPALTQHLASAVAQKWLLESSRQDSVTRYLESQVTTADNPPTAAPTVEERALEKLTHSSAYQDFLAREQPAEVPLEMRTKPTYLKQLAAFDWMRRELLTQLQLVARETVPATSRSELATLFPAGFDKSQLQVIAERGNALADSMLTQYVGQLRKLAEQDNKPAMRPQLPLVLEKVAERESLSVLKQLLADVEILPDGSARRSPAPARQYLTERANPNFSFGCGRRTYLLTPPKWRAEEVQAGAIATACQCVAGSDENIYICEELQDISLAQLASLHAAKDRQASEAIDHLHTRVDVAWGCLATPIASEVADS
ncbi:MAG TPA: tubulin-like doman-containing protein [Pirellulaceae bacterium]|nr:tubulin-like doman-containing protein [Pirellulaceae bacterium]